MADKDLLISQIVEETYEESNENSSSDNCVDLQKYFEKKLNQVEFYSINDYLDQQLLTYQPLELEESISCYRLMFNDSTLDFPSNWSIFEEINDRDLLFLDQSSDQDFLLDIFAELFGNAQNIVLLKENQKVKLVIFQDENCHDHIKWMLSYFEKKNGRSLELKIAA